MKTIFFRGGTIAVATTALFMVSCSNDDIMPSVSSGDEVQVSFAIANPYGAVTRAISDGKTVNQLTYAVYDGEGNKTKLDAVTMDAEFPKVVNITLSKGQDYKIVFWADTKDAGMYTFNDTTATIMVDYKVHNNDVADAFFAMQEVNVTADAALDVTLYRPFAQLNVGTADEYAASLTGIEIVSSEVTVKGLANSLNLLDGTTDGDIDFTFEMTEIPSDKLIVSDSAYTYLAMDYLLVPGNKSTVDAAYTFKPYAGNDITCKVPAIPVQANYRTNLLGNILTSDIQFTLKIDSAFNQPDNNIEILSGLAEIAEYGGEITLPTNLVLNRTLVFKADAVVNLNGKTITMADSISGVACPFKVDNGATLTINGDGKVDAGKNATTANIAVWSKDGKVIINGGHYINDYATVKPTTVNGSNYSDLIYTSGGEIEINGGTFETRCEAYNGWHYVLNQHNTLGAAIVVKGGTFINYDPASGDDYLGGNFVDNDYESIETKTGVWTVSLKPDEQIFYDVADEDCGITSVTLRWPAGEAAEKIVILPGDITHTITEAEIATGAATIEGLTSETTYTAVMKHGARTRGTVKFTTTFELDGATLVNPGDDFAKMLAKADEGTSFAFMPGEYKLGVVSFTKNVSIKAAKTKSDQPVLYMLVSLKDNISVTIENIVLDGTDLGEYAGRNGDQAIQFNGSNSVYGDVTVSGCTIRNWMKGIIYFNSTAGYANSITFDNNMIYNIECSGGDFFDCRIGTGKIINFTNNTVYNSCAARDFIRIDDNSSSVAVAPVINVSNNTLYGVANNTAKRLLYVRWANNKITFANNIVANTAGYFTNQKATNITWGNNNYFNADGCLTNSTTNAKVDNSGTAIQLDPQFKDAEGGDFTVGNQAVIDAGVGAQRWLNK